MIPLPPAASDRTGSTREKIFAGTVAVLARSGVAGVTHRAVAKAGGVSLAATTYHFDSKADLLDHVSAKLLNGYLDSFRQLQARVTAGAEAGLGTLDDLVLRVVLNAIGRERMRSLACCELILQCGREAEGQGRARDWYGELDRIWFSIGRHLEPAITRGEARAAIDLSVGLTFLFHPLDLDREAAIRLFDGDLTPGDLAAARRGRAQPTAGHGTQGAGQGEARARIVAAAIEVLVERGRMAVSYRNVAERAGLVRSGPAYHFRTIGALLQTAQHALLARATARYLSTLETFAPERLDETRLIDLATALHCREVLLHGLESIGFHAICAAAAQGPALRPAVTAALVEQHRAWSRLLGDAAQGGPPQAVPLRVQALMAGKTIRAAATGPDMALLARAREDFASAIRGGRRDPAR